MLLVHCRLIRLSSPNLNYLIGLGAIVLYLNVIVLVIPTTNPEFAAVLCNVSECGTPRQSLTLFLTLPANFCASYDCTGLPH